MPVFAASYYMAVMFWASVNPPQKNGVPKDAVSLSELSYDNSAAELLEFDEVIFHCTNFLNCQHALHDGCVGVNLIVANFFFGDKASRSTGEAGCDIIGTLQ